MSEGIERLKGKKISILVTGAKGVVAIKGEFEGMDGDFLRVQLEKGMMGKPKITFFSKYGIIGIRVED